MFNVHYIADTKEFSDAWGWVEQPERLGEIIAYQEGPGEQPAADITKGCRLLTFPNVQAIFDPLSFRVCKKVDVETETLIAIA